MIWINNEAEKCTSLKNISLETPMDEINDLILHETDLEQFNRIKSLFDLNIKKKELLRLSKLNELQDLTVDEISRRLENKPGEFNNKDLIEYFKIIQDTINKSNTSLDDIDISSIKVIQNQLNINVNDENQLSRESKNKVINAVKAILNKANNENFIDIEKVESENIDEIIG